MLQADKEQDHSQKDDPLRMSTNYCKDRQSSKNCPVNQNTLLLKEGINNVPSIELAHRNQIQSCYEKPCPTGEPDWIEQQIVTFRQGSMNPVGQHGEKDRVAE